jgi:hypothetical protein
MTYTLGTLTTSLKCFFGTGKSLRNHDEWTLESGAQIKSRFDADGYHKFTTTDSAGRMETWAIRNASVLDTAIGLDDAPSLKSQAITEICRLMKIHGIDPSEIS